MGKVGCEALLLGPLRELAGVDSVALVLEAPATAADAWEAVVRAFPQVGSARTSLAVAINAAYCSWAVAVADNDVLAFIPPVSGG